MQLQPQNLLYTVSKLPPGTFRPALKPSAAASALAPKGCGTVAASAPKPPFYIRFQNCSSARFARPRNPLLHLAAASAVAKLLQLQPQNILSIRLRNCRFPTLKRSWAALCAKGCETVAASAPKPPFYTVSKLPVGTLRPALKRSDAASARCATRVAKLLQLRPRVAKLLR